MIFIIFIWKECTYDRTDAFFNFLFKMSISQKHSQGSSGVNLRRKDYLSNFHEDIFHWNIQNMSL